MKNTGLIPTDPIVDNIIHLAISDAKASTGVPLTATGSGAVFGVKNTIGTASNLLSAAAATSTVSALALWEDRLGPLFQPGAALTVSVNANLVLAATATVSTGTINAALYRVNKGIYSTNTLSGSPQPIISTAADYNFVVPQGNIFQPGDRFVIELLSNVVETAGHNAEAQINSVHLDSA